MKEQISCPIRNHAQMNPQKTAVISAGIVLTYHELNQKINDCCVFLTQLGLTEGLRVAINAPLSISYIVLLWALWRKRAVTCLMNDKETSENIIRSMKAFQCRLYVSDFGKAIEDIEIGTTKMDINDLMNFSFGDDPASDEHSVDYNKLQPAVILFTSGSTSSPKAVQLSFGSLYMNALGANQNIPVYQNDSWLLSLPLFHVSGLGIMFRTLIGGGSLILAEKQEDIPALIAEHNITHASFVPTQLYRLLNNDKARISLKRLRYILLGGSVIPSALVDEALKLDLPVYASYGLTEMASQVATTSRLTKKDIPIKAKLLPGRELKILPNGEICVRGETLCDGYIINSKLQRPFDPDGWFHTGDLGSFEGGLLKVTGRKDSMFICCGENIYPEEIERILEEVSGVEKAVVIPMPHQEYGQIPVAFIKNKNEGQVTRRSLTEHLETRVIKPKIPKEFYVYPDHMLSDGLKEGRRYLAQILAGDEVTTLKVIS